MPEKLQLSALPEAHFGEILYELRQMRCLSQRQLAKMARLPPSCLSEIENTRRAPPPLAKVQAIMRALQLPEHEQHRLIAYAEQERARLGLKVNKNTPRHVAELLREISAHAEQISPAHALMIKKNLAEAMMK